LRTSRSGRQGFSKRPALKRKSEDITSVGTSSIAKSWRAQIGYGVPSFRIQLQLYHRLSGRFVGRGSSDARSTRNATGHDVLRVRSSAGAESVFGLSASVRFVAEPLGRLSRRHSRRKVNACDGRSSGLGEGT
jgi:hypothetical protein